MHLDSDVCRFTLSQHLYHVHWERDHIPTRKNLEQEPTEGSICRFSRSKPRSALKP